MNNNLQKSTNTDIKEEYENLPSELRSKNWEINSDKKGFSILIPYNNILKDYFLKITRNLKEAPKKYSYSILNNEKIQIGDKIYYNEFITQNKPILIKKYMKY